MRRLMIVVAPLAPAVALWLAPVPAAAQSSHREAWHLCERQDPAAALERAVAGCTWLLAPGRESTGNRAIALFNRANARSAQGDRAAAIADYDQAIRLDPRIPFAFNNRGLLRAEQGDIAGAIADYDQAIRLDPGYAQAFSNRGLARAMRGDHAGAIDDYAGAIRADPRFILAFNNRGLARAALGDSRGAIADYDQAIRLEPRYAVAFNNRGLAHAALRSPEAAEIELAALRGIRADENLAKLDSPAFPVSAVLGVVDAWLAGKVAGARGQLQAAREHLEQAVAAAGRLPYMEPAYWPLPVRPSLGAACLAAGDAVAAEAVFRADLKDWPRNGWGLLGLERSLRAQGRDALADSVQRQFNAAWQRADVPLDLAWF